MTKSTATTMKYFLPLFFLFIASGAAGQVVKNTSYTTRTGERVLRLELVLPVTQKEAWDVVTTDNQLKKWIAPLAHIELRTGGYIMTNYDKTKSLDVSSSIRLDITSYLEQELITFKVKLNDNFSKKVQGEDKNLQEIIQFENAGAGKTKVTSSMIGWGEGEDWKKVYDFFVRGNIYTYEELLKLYIR